MGVPWGVPWGRAALTRPLRSLLLTPANHPRKVEKVFAAFADAEAKGSASIKGDGFFVDYPVVEQARRTLDLIKRIRG